jgi:Skp family chaperone for outer membrane proteins
MAEDNKRLIEIVSELLFEVQGMRMDVRQEVGQLRNDLKQEVGQLRNEFKQEVGQLREDLNRNHAKAMAGLMEVRTSVVRLDEKLIRLVDVEERLRKLEATVYGKVG